MSESEDFYYRRKPAVSIARRRTMDPEVRLASYTYEDEMHARDGTLPDERSDKGMRWHQTVLGVRNSRTVKRVVAALLDCGDLVRLSDGRLTSKEVQAELAHRARKRGRGPGEGGQGGAGGERGRQLVLIDGGKAPHAPVDNPEDSGGEAAAPAEVGSNRGRTDPESGANQTRCRAKSPMKSTGGSPYHSRAIANQMVVVAESRFPARARGDPWPALA